MHLEINKSRDWITIYVDGVQVWEGSIGDWTKAISHPSIGQKRAA